MKGVQSSREAWRAGVRWQTQEGCRGSWGVPRPKGVERMYEGIKSTVSVSGVRGIRVENGMFYENGDI